MFLADFYFRDTTKGDLVVSKCSTEHTSSAASRAFPVGMVSSELR